MKTNKSIKFYCSDGDQVGCGSQLEIVKELPSNSSTAVYFECKCPKCKLEWEVSHDMESGETFLEVFS
jgi:hypothetical protein